MQDLYLIEGETLRRTADAIRTRRGTIDPIDPVDYEAEILSIQGGGGSEEDLDTELNAQTQMLNELEDEIESIEVDDSGSGMDGNTIVNYLAGAYSGKVIDYEGKVTVLNAYSFANQEITEGYFPNVSIIGASVSSARGSVFYNCTQLSKLYCPKVETIYGPSNFYKCSTLESLRFPLLTNSWISASEFSGCSNLRFVEFPAAKSVSSNAFNSCSMLEECITGGLSRIGTDAFGFCRNLNSISFDSTTVVFSSRAFRVCGLKSVFISCTSNVTFADSLFINNSRLENVYISASALISTQTAEECFMKCSSLRGVEFNIENGSMYLTKGMFSGCTELVNVKISCPAGISAVGNSCFYGCSSLKWGDLSKANIIYLGMPYGFRSCVTLDYVDAPFTTHIGGASAFQYCYKLSYVSVPNAITFGATGLFSSCSALEYVYAPKVKNFQDSSIFYECKKLASIYIMQESGLTEADVPTMSDAMLFSTARGAYVGTNTSDHHVWIYVGYPEYVPWLQSATNWATYSSWIVASQFVPQTEE